MNSIVSWLTSGVDWSNKCEKPAEKGVIMSQFEDSIRCKYCSHFEPGANRCHLYHDFDQSLDKSGGPYLKETSPNSRCSRFSVTARDAILRDVLRKDAVLGDKAPTRPDGSPIVGLEALPEIKKRILKEEAKERRGEKLFHMFGATVASFVISFIIAKFAAGFIELLEPIISIPSYLPTLFVVAVVGISAICAYKYS